MRKLLVTLGILALGTSMALAYGPGMGRGFHGGGFGASGQNYNQNVGPGWGGCPGANYYSGQQQTAEPLSEKEAIAKVEEFITANLKGFEISDVQQFNVPMGIMYQVSVEDVNENTFLLRVNPFGYVMGPLPVNNFSQQ